MTNQYRASEYLGDLDENGWLYDGDLESYCHPENWGAFKIMEDEDGKLQVWHVLLGGKWTHELQIKDEIAALDIKGDDRQAVYRDWYENRRATGKAARDPERWARENG